MPTSFWHGERPSGLRHAEGTSLAEGLALLSKGMPPADFQEIFAALEREQVRYLVVGGVAVVLHGYGRLTADLDLVVHLDPHNLRKAASALSPLGYRPRAPVTLEAFVDPANRRQWIEEKGLTVLSLWSPDHPLTEIDIFVEEPLPFDETYKRAERLLLGTVTVTVIAIADLIVLKRKAGRAKDLDDARVLEEFLRSEGNA